MIARFYDLSGQEVNKEPIQLETKSIYKAIIMMKELGFEYVSGSDFKPLALMSRGNERAMVTWE